MEPDAVLTLFDSSWFYPQIFKHQSQSQTSPSSPQIQEISSKPMAPSPLRFRSRSKSEDLSSYLNTDVSFPNSQIIIKPTLQTILSEKEFALATTKTPHTKKPNKLLDEKNKKKKKKKSALSKSLSQLEFEELKGFMDLGFVFSEEDKESSLVEIIPGLQRLGQKEQRNGEELSEARITRPYLSEAWQDLDDEQKNNKEARPLMMGWRIPAANGDIDMKDSLKWWAHTVASAVR